MRLTRACEGRIAAGEWPALDQYEDAPYDYAGRVRFITESAAFPRSVCEHHGLPEGVVQ